MRIHRTSRRVRWEVPSALLVALAIAVPAGIASADNGGNSHSGNAGIGNNENVANTGLHPANPGVDPGPPSPPPPSASFTLPYLHEVANIAFPSPYAATMSDDISWVDSNLHAYYLADRTNNGVDAVNTLTDTFGGVIGAGDFAGAGAIVTGACGGKAQGGPNGVLSLTVDGVNQLWAADGVATSTGGVSTLKVFTLTTPTSSTSAPTTISTADGAFGTTGTCRADEVAYDSQDNIFIVANDEDNPPYLTEISVKSNPSSDTIVGQIKFPGATGLEQTIWDPTNDRFYTNIPGVGLAVINPKTSAIVTTYTAFVSSCSGNSGLALDPYNQTLLSACSVNQFGSALLSATTGAVLARFPQVSGSDENWYDPGTNTFYLGASGMTSNGTTSGYPTPVIGAIWAGGRGDGHGHGPGAHVEPHGPRAQWLSNFATGSGTKPSRTDTHSVAADSTNGQVFVPVLGYGISVLTDTPAPTGL